MLDCEHQPAHLDNLRGEGLRKSFAVAKDSRRQTSGSSGPTWVNVLPRTFSDIQHPLWCFRHSTCHTDYFMKSTAFLKLCSPLVTILNPLVMQIVHKPGY